MNKLISQFREGSIDVDAYVDGLMDLFDAAEPRIFSFVPEARRWRRVAREAAYLVQRWPDISTRPPLFGVPIGVKDIFHVDGMATRAGSSLSPELLKGEQSVAVTALLDAGALIIGKTITTEFAWFGPGPARNPHNPLHTPGGSSSGSAAAVGAGIVPIALGSQTIGSINRPAAFCGCVGFKPSYDRISRDGVVELSRSHDHVGVLADCVDSAELAISIMMPDWKGKAESGKGKAVLGVPDGPYLQKADASGLRHFESGVKKLESLGYTVKRVDVMADFDELEMQHRRLLAADAARYHAQFGDWQNLYQAHLQTLIERGKQVTEDEISADIQAKCDLAIYLGEIMDANGIDLWLTPPAIGPAPVGHASTGDPVMQLPWTMAGFPMINLPWGNLDGMPMGLQFVGRFGTDEALFGMARKLEADMS